eukprot:9440729-Pyramimonas_sp.AAC.1
MQGYLRFSRSSGRLRVTWGPIRPVLRGAQKEQLRALCVGSCVDRETLNRRTMSVTICAREL